jgi:Tol biopolymer transport system component
MSGRALLQGFPARLPALPALAIAILTLAGCSQQALRPSISPDGDSVAVVHGGQLYSIAVDGSGVTELTKGAELSRQQFSTVRASWSPDGTELAFARDDGVYLLDVGTGDARRLAAGTDPEWSPVGDLIAFRDASDRLRVVAADGSANTELSPRPIDLRQRPWAPDGRRIVAIDSADCGLHLYDARTSMPKALTSGVDAEPTWSQDGRRLAFIHSPHGSGDCQAESIAEFEVRILDVATGIPSTLWTGTERVKDVVWVEDDSSVAMIIDGRISLVDVATRQIRALGGVTRAEGMSWSSASGSIVYYEVAARDQDAPPGEPDGRLWTVDVSTGERHVLAEAPTFSPGSPRSSGPITAKMPPDLLAGSQTAYLSIDRHPLRELGIGRASSDGQLIAGQLPDLLPSGRYDLVVNGNGDHFAGPIWVGRIDVVKGPRSLMALAFLVVGFLLVVLRVRGRCAAELTAAGSLMLSGIFISHVIWIAGLLLLGIGITGLARTTGFTEHAFLRRSARLAGIGALLAGSTIPIAIAFFGVDAQGLVWTIVDFGISVFAAGSLVFAFGMLTEETLGRSRFSAFAIVAGAVAWAALRFVEAPAFITYVWLSIAWLTVAASVWLRATRVRSVDAGRVTA